MTQEDKELLLKDLSARLPYVVMCDRLGVARKVLSINQNKTECIELDRGEYMPAWYNLEEVKPYLRPMSSMTEKECIELGNISATMENLEEHIPNVPYYIEIALPEQIDWLNAHHFDFHNLIDKGLAIEVTKENNPYV